ncbi:MAG: hypothetical protein Q9195_009554 [Heterodermia aff. obscurata]
MAVNAFLEPFVVISLLTGGTIINRNKRASISASFPRSRASPGDPFDHRLERGFSRTDSSDALYKSADSGLILPSLLPDIESKWRRREVGFLSWRKGVTCPNTHLYRGTLLSRILRRFPFLVEAWYWALIYWVYQLGRAFTAVRFDQHTVDVARHHAFDLIRIEKALGIFWELQLQARVLKHTMLLSYTNWIYSYIHIPATISFLVWLYYHTITSANSVAWSDHVERRLHKVLRGASLYEARRRTMAMCNLIAFTIFTTWPCMPPRLLSDPSVNGPDGDHARSYGFVDTVHGASGSGSVWTSNKFCNQWAAMPSLHFGYSLLIGFTIMTLPLSPNSISTSSGKAKRSGYTKLPSWRRCLCITCGVLYPAIILFAVIATANHFILDVVAGALVCGLAWVSNRLLLNLLPLEDCFLWLLRIHKPEVETEAWPELDEVEG